MGYTEMCMQYCAAEIAGKNTGLADDADDSAGQSTGKSAKVSMDADPPEESAATSTAEKKSGVYLENGSKNSKATSKRLQYMGKTPSKNSKTGNAVIEQMKREGKIKEVRGEFLFRASDNRWYPLNQADMAHKIDAVTWWNNIGRNYGPKSPEVRKFMLNPDNYYLEHYSINRSQGAKLKQQYLPPK